MKLHHLLTVHTVIGVSLPDFSSWQLQIGSQSPGLMDGLSSRKALTQAASYRGDMWTARCVSSCASQARMAEQKTSGTWQPRRNRKGALAHHRLRLKWVSTSSRQVQDRKCPEPFFRFQASGSWEHRCAIRQTWRPGSRRSTSPRPQKNVSGGLILGNSLVFKALLYALGVIKKQHFQLSDKALEMRKGFQKRKSLCFVRVHL